MPKTRKPALAPKRQMTEHEVTKCLVKILSLQDEAKRLYQEADRLSLSLVPHAPVFPEFIEFNGEKKTPEIVDNYADGNNIAYRPAGVKRIELKFRKYKGAKAAA